ncbi:extracellular solute-binding protein [Cuniculiplasma divulgatum]|jgi:arabinogalactan oligomer/maltooligosaccharide transport system substrate-binding protein|uniref:Extracellular solute-binding protein n=2 Tax=Cuniculiplasma divulgatum TaxID=1673428 RepID=A0A1N5W649_9ARCH|nr:extracellular solute-binding protein [Cuniculiplasma divulgatum]SJK85405.1 extracellular solute-binding protein [Cuniculiplasma divulgatum]
MVFLISTGDVIMANNNIKLKRKKITGTSVRNKLKVLSVLMVVGIFVLTAFVTVYDHPTLGSSGVVTPSASSGNHVTITVWGSGSPGGEEEVFNSTLAYFEQVYPNVTVDDSPAVGIASTTYTSAAHAGKAPDIYRDSSDNAGVLYAEGTVLALNKYLNSTYIKSFSPGTITAWSANNSLYGIPVNTNGVGLYYNSKFVKTAPKTVYQMIQDALNVTHNTTLNPSGSATKVWGLAYGLGTDSGYRSAAWFPAFGGTLFNSKQMPVLNSTGDIKAVSFLYNLTYKYHVSPTGLTTMTQQYNLFEDNQSAFMIDGPWDQSTYTQYLGSNLHVTALPFNNATGLWPTPIWGSVGYFISSPQASGITSSQIWASLKFIEMLTNTTAQIHLFDKAGDFPSSIAAGNYITAHSNNDPLIKGWLDQENHTMPQPGFVNMNYYWPNFHTYVGNLYDNGTNNVSQTMNDFQRAVVNEINELSAKPTSISISLYDILAIVAVVIIVAAAASVVYVRRKKK